MLELIAPLPRPAKRARASQEATKSVGNRPAASKKQSKGNGKNTGTSTSEVVDHAVVDLPAIPQTPSGRMLRPRRTSTSINSEQGSVPPPTTPPRSMRKAKAALHPAESFEEPCTLVKETIELDGFEVTSSRRRSSRQRKPVNLD